MAVRTKQLFQGAPANGVAVYTVPAGRRTIVKSWSACSISTTCTLKLQIGGVAGNKIRIWQQDTVADVIYRNEFWFVLEAGQNISLFTNAGTPSLCTWLISGTELVL